MARRISKRDVEAKREQEVFDHDNPEWTEEDFSRARAPHEVLPESVLKAFPKTRGPQVASKKIPVSIRLSPEVVERFKADGPGWQSRIDDVLKKAIGL
jgi:uncharacterized protein (DUF4415 family)